MMRLDESVTSPDLVASTGGLIASAEASAKAAGAFGGDRAVEPEGADILLVEDDALLRAEIAAYLRQQGYVIHEAADVKTADQHLKSHPIDLVVLDVMLPGEDGLSLCRRLANNGGAAVLMLSAMGEAIDRVLGLELGADDYVVKPVAPRELLARVRALLRRRGAGGVERTGRRTGYAFAGFRFDMVRRRLEAPDGDVIMLTPGELGLLGAFLERPQTILSREALFQFSRGDAAEGLDRAIDIQISRLRRKLNDKAAGEIIKTRRGLGYCLDAKVAPF